MSEQLYSLNINSEMAVNQNANVSYLAKISIYNKDRHVL